MSVRPYLSVKNALEAIELYKNIFGAKLISHVRVDKNQAPQFGLSEDQDFSHTTMHAEFSINGAPIYISDNFTGEVLEKTNVTISIEPESEDQINKYYNAAIEAGCAEGMKLAKQFWGDWFGSFADPFGISWQLNYSPEENKD